MRKKTIQEELEELEKEKENHIKKISQKTGHSDDHVYDFDAKYETHDFENSSTSNIRENKFVGNAQSKTKTGHVKFGTGLFYLIFLVPCISLFGFSALGLYLLIGGGFIPLAKNLSYVEVTSIVQHVDVEYIDDQAYAKIEVSFIYNDSPIVCTISEHIYSMDDIPEIGDQLQLKINPNNPYEADLAENNYTSIVICIIFGSFLALLCGVGATKIIKTLIASRKNLD